jgi:hypothetical protein
MPSPRLLLSLFAFLVGALPAQADLDAKLDATKEFVRYFKKAKEESLQVEAICTLKGNECRPAAEELLKPGAATPISSHPHGR